MKKIILFAIMALVPTVSFAQAIETHHINSTLSLNNAASITGLNDIEMMLVSGQPSQPNAVYEGSDIFEVDTNIDLSLIVSATPLKHFSCTDTVNPLANCAPSEIIELTTNTLSQQNVFVGVTNVTLTSTATLGNKISDQKAGEYSSVVTITAAPQ